VVLFGWRTAHASPPPLFSYSYHQHPLKMLDWRLPVLDRRRAVSVNVTLARLTSSLEAESPGRWQCS